ncbi:hypothetical protein Tco_0105686 [Tanacetum coccineum]
MIIVVSLFWSASRFVFAADEVEWGWPDKGTARSRGAGIKWCGECSWGRGGWMEAKKVWRPGVGDKGLSGSRVCKRENAGGWGGHTGVGREESAFPLCGGERYGTVRGEGRVDIELVFGVVVGGWDFGLRGIWNDRDGVGWGFDRRKGVVLWLWMAQGDEIITGGWLGTSVSSSLGKVAYRGQKAVYDAWLPGDRSVFGNAWK